MIRFAEVGGSRCVCSVGTISMDLAIMPWNHCRKCPQRVLHLLRCACPTQHPLCHTAAAGHSDGSLLHFGDRGSLLQIILNDTLLEAAHKRFGETIEPNMPLPAIKAIITTPLPNELPKGALVQQAAS